MERFPLFIKLLRGAVRWIGAAATAVLMFLLLFSLVAAMLPRPTQEQLAEMERYRADFDARRENPTQPMIPGKK